MRYRVDFAAGEVVELADEATRTGEALTQLTEQFVPGAAQEEAPTDLSEREEQDRPDEPPKSFFGVGELLSIAQEDDGQVDEDTAAKEELRRQSHQDAFGEDSELSDDEMFEAYLRQVGGQE